MNLNKKALATITLVILLVANGFSVFADEIDYSPKITTTTADINVVSTEEKYSTTQDTTAYLIPTISSNSVCEIKEGQEVEPIMTIANWSKVKYNGIEAWIATTDYDVAEVVVDNTVEETVQETTTVEEQANQIAQAAQEQATKVAEVATTVQAEVIPVTEVNKNGYTNGSANLRDAASDEGDVVKTIAKNTNMSVIFQQGDWYKVSINGEEGYIHTSLITMGTYVPPVAAPAPAASASSGSVPAYVPDANASKASQVVSLAMSFVGSRYVYGGSSPSTGFDCSGFTSYIYRQFGVSLYRSSTEQVKNGTPIDKSQLQPGDLLLFRYHGSSTCGHVGIYIGGGQFVHAANSRQGVRVDALSSSYYASNYYGARRVL